MKVWFYLLFDKYMQDVHDTLLIIFLRVWNLGNDPPPTAPPPHWGREEVI